MKTKLTTLLCACAVLAACSLEMDEHNAAWLNSLSFKDLPSGQVLATWKVPPSSFGFARPPHEALQAEATEQCFVGTAAEVERTCAPATFPPFGCITRTYRYRCVQEQEIAQIENREEVPSEGYDTWGRQTEY